MSTVYMRACPRSILTLAVDVSTCIEYTSGRKITEPATPGPWPPCIVQLPIVCPVMPPQRAEICFQTRVTQRCAGKRALA